MMLNKIALEAARKALWVRRRERFKQLVDFKILTPPTNNAMLEDARAAIEAFVAALPDDGLVNELRKEIENIQHSPPVSSIIWELLRKAANALEAALAKSDAPKGWRLVPEEPTEEMARCIHPEDYRRLLAAAPEPPDKPDG